MALKVTNVSSNLILVRLRSGDTVHLRPGEQTRELPDAEIKDNPRVTALVERHLVSVDKIPEAKKGRRSASATAEEGSE